MASLKGDDKETAPFFTTSQDESRRILAQEWQETGQVMTQPKISVSSFECKTAKKEIVNRFPVDLDPAIDLSFKYNETTARTFVSDIFRYQTSEIDLFFFRNHLFCLSSCSFLSHHFLLRQKIPFSLSLFSLTRQRDNNHIDCVQESKREMTATGNGMSWIFFRKKSSSLMINCLDKKNYVRVGGYNARTSITWQLMKK